MEIGQLSGSFGARLAGIDPGRPVDDAVTQEIARTVEPKCQLPGNWEARALSMWYIGNTQPLMVREKIVPRVTRRDMVSPA
jgi:hypothetical protein